MGFTITIGFNNNIYWGGQNKITGAQIWRCTEITDIAGNYNISEIMVYPNPVSDKITIEDKVLIKDKKVSIYNMQGQLMLQQPIKQIKTDIDISELEKSVYVLKIESSEKTEVTKIVKE